MRTTLLSVAAAALFLATVTACDDPAAAPAAAGGTATTTTAAVSAADLCGFLEKNLAEWQSIGSEVGAMARMTTDLFGFYEDNGVTPVGSDMDEQTLAKCPKVRTEVLKTGGLESFQTL